MEYALDKELSMQGILTIEDIIHGVTDNFCLPAIQRGVVWKKENIAELFDSIYKGFPVGNILLWPLNSTEDRESTRFYGIATSDEANDLRHKRAIKNFISDTHRRFCIIDGQQRITALYRGLCCKYKDNNKDYYLFFNPLHTPASDAFKYYLPHRVPIGWVKVKDIWDKYLRNTGDIAEDYYRKIANDYKRDGWKEHARGGQYGPNTPKAVAARGALSELEHNKKLFKERFASFLSALKASGLPYQTIDLHKINSNEETLSKLFDVFVRLNDSGKPLDPTDFLFAQLAQKNARIGDDIEELVFAINNEKNGAGKKSRFTQGNILRLIWLLERKNQNTSFKQFFMDEASNVIIDSEKLQRIKTALLRAKEAYIFNELTFSGSVSYDAFLPIACYFFYRGSYNKRQIKVEIGKYFETATISGAYSKGTDDVMSKAVKALRVSYNKVGFDRKEFVFQKFLENYRDDGGTQFNVTEDTIENILKLKYGPDKDLIKSILAMIARTHDINYCPQDVDHMHPKKFADPEKESDYYSLVPNGNCTENAEKLKFYRKHVNDFANLQLLSKDDNRTGKNDSPLKNWLQTFCADTVSLETYAQQQYVCKPNTPIDFDFFAIENFEAFIDARKRLLKEKLLEIMNYNTQE